MTDDPDQLVFSYGALQLAELQRAILGRIFSAEDDMLPGFTLDYADMADPRFGELTGTSQHPVLRRTGDPRDKIIGKVYRFTEDELDAADQFEVLMFRREQVTLASGRTAWVYLTG
ncbi:gamma-glutamylcyclotransferase family protein [Microbacterium sp. RU33B]|uniref:gamma-glutamylcyclotransferase family protein n=1 Tax=Microbacterium sp. RU33B TaxID=1907390 RepID=UPI000963EC24|nr:gamma-glutamylcyclotransferase family protein [Microbacterium sp. RU33B]SIT70540.1 Gamma-glutamyl cyclotransferase, AIG2-like [Microbacterium sp. RU33B]